MDPSVVVTSQPTPETPNTPPPRTIRGGRGRNPRAQSRRAEYSQHQAPTSDSQHSQPSTSERRPRGGGRNTRRKREGDVVLVNDGTPAQSRSSGQRTARRSNHPSTGNQNDSPNAEAGGSAPPRRNAPFHRGRRGMRFNANLTEGSTSAEPDEKQHSSKKYSSKAPKGDDLTSRLIHEISTHPYPDCPICFSPITPAQPTWHCSPPDGADSNPHCCWTPFHLKCIHTWASKSVKDFIDAWSARGEGRPGEWRCPGCQAKREAVPSGYWCFCGAHPEPKPPRLAIPHSCGNSCSRKRACGHSCPISCHPGPCPPCQVTTELPCHCGAKIMAFKCAKLRTAQDNLSCGNACHKKLGCGNHVCEDVCHPGECQPCPIREIVKCYCGKEEKEVACGEGEAKVCIDSTSTWTGRYACANPCNRPFDCGLHHCSKPCHPPSSTPTPCPQSPSRVTHCPCGKHPLVPESAPFFPPESASQLVRTSCSSPIPTCNSTCLKPLPHCTHVCSAPCHTGPCPPCSAIIGRPCRCGATKRNVRCSDLQKDGVQIEITCDKPCQALRACGKHRCNRPCCPLAGLSKGKGKARKQAYDDMEPGTEPGGLHECDLVCGKMLSCGLHQCEERDHRGLCPPCLRSSFEEMICHCGRTVLEPPIPCGTKMQCHYPCTRDPPACGHPSVPHSCHEDPIPCPPCQFLTSKACMCGKKEVKNVRCSVEKVSCGTACGKVLECGFHRCERSCHNDECGPCTAECGKPRKLCLPAIHPCTDRCHAPSACAEVEPCQALITLTCPCGRLMQSVHCGKSVSNPAGRTYNSLKCSSECAIAKRNARLAEALGINATQDKDKWSVTWKDEVVAFARSNPKLLQLVEKTFADFVTSARKSQILPHMPPDRRKFVHDVAAVYRIDTQMVDQEPNRSVQLIRRIDTRIPNPLLSASLTASSTSNAGLGKLATRVPSPATPASGSLTPRQTPAPTPVRGWASAASRSNTPDRLSAKTPDTRPASTAPVNDPVADNWEDDV